MEVFVKDGIGLCMDDFGSGYANLNAVLKLPFQCIKMDRSMLNDIRQHKVAGEFYRNIVTILRQQGYAIVAEGVEEQEEVELLEAWGVDMIQGYYFSRPLPVEEFLKKIDGVDLILTEGFKQGPWPKIMLHRKGTGKPMPLLPEECLAVISDVEILDCENVFTLEEIEKTADFYSAIYRIYHDDNVNKRK